MTTEVTAADEVVTIEQRLKSTLVELEAVEGNIVRLADEVARLLATGSSVTKAEESVAKARALADNLRSRRDALQRLLAKTEATAAEDAALLAKIDAAERLKAAEEKFADARSRLVCSLKGVTLDLADCAKQHALAQIACADLGPGTGANTGDMNSWYFRDALLDEVVAAAFAAAGAVQESHRVTLTLRVPALGGPS